MIVSEGGSKLEHRFNKLVFFGSAILVSSRVLVSDAIEAEDPAS